MTSALLAAALYIAIATIAAGILPIAQVANQPWGVVRYAHVRKAAMGSPDSPHSPSIFTILYYDRRRDSCLNKNPH